MTSNLRPRVSPVMILGSVALAALLLWTWTGSSAAPKLNWRIEAELADGEVFAEVPVETPIRLELELPWEAHVYVASFDLLRGSIAMFPSTYLRTEHSENPLPAGHHELPGRLKETQLEWHSGDAPGPISIMVVVSETALPDLEATMLDFRQMGNAAFPTRAKLGTYAPKGGMSETPARTKVHSTYLRAACDLLDPERDGAMWPMSNREGVYLKVLRLQTPSNMSPESIREQALRKLGNPLQGLPQPPK